VNQSRKRVLFVCVGNACRSQMAEGFATAYGQDVLVAASAGIAPAFAIPKDTERAMMEKNIDIKGHFPKSIKHLGRAEFDLTVNMSEVDIRPDVGPNVMEWKIEDPYGKSFEHYRHTRDRIELLVMDLIMRLRREAQGPHFHSLHRDH
jgi:arsenate reductase (thioredoxin)